MPRFNFNTISLSNSADISKIQENFAELEANGINYTEATKTATTSANGLMTSADKTKLNGIETGAEANNITTVKLNNVTQTISDKTLSLEETDPTVPSWAKENTKPSYVWSEVGSKPTFVTQSVVTNFWKGTQAQYDALGTYDSATLYMIIEEAD